MATLQDLLEAIPSGLPDTVFEVLQNPENNSSSFSTFLNLTSQSDRVSHALNRRDITLFAPNDDAFRLFSEQVDSHLYPNVLNGTFMADDAWNLHVEDLLLHHFLPSRFLLADLSNSSIMIAMNGEEITIDGQTTAGDGSRNVFNQGFINSDIVARNGIVHVVNQLMSPAWMNRTIFDVAAEGEFSTFLSLADWTGISELLSSSSESFNGPYTVFLPTNDAFEQLAIAMGTNLTTLDVGYVTDILRYHIILGIHTAEHFTVGFELDSLLPRESVAVTSPLDVLGVDALINDVAPIVQTDVLAKNGIVHVLSGVALPSKPDPYMEFCLNLKSIEETLSLSSPAVLDVVCSCNRAPGSDIRNVLLTCTETFGGTSSSNITGAAGGSDGGTDYVDGANDGDDTTDGFAIACTARGMYCSSTHQCCSAPLRKCTNGKCADSHDITTLESNIGGDEDSKSDLRTGIDQGGTVRPGRGEGGGTRQRRIRGGG
jgi:uncharacterized surface protein with fasciclin (FAS1) repeats